MAFLALLVAVVLIVAAIRNTHTQLLGALGQDVPGFVVWGAAIFGVAVIGFIPGLKPVSRGLLALIVVVLILTNYKGILSGFTNAWQGAPAQAAGTPAQGSGGGFGDLNSLGHSFGFDFSSILGTDNAGGGQAVNG